MLTMKNEKAKKTHIFKFYYQKLDTAIRTFYANYDEYDFVKTYRKTVSGRLLWICVWVLPVVIISETALSLRSEADFKTQKVICGKLIYAATRKKTLKGSSADETFVKISAAGNEEKFKISSLDGNVKGSGIGIKTKEVVKEWSDLHKGSQVCIEFIRTPVFRKIPLSVCLLDNPLECLAEEKTRKRKYLQRSELTFMYYGSGVMILTSLSILLNRMRKMKKNRSSKNSSNKEIL